MEKQSQMLQHYQAWELSGLTMKQYAQRHKINYKTFNNWCNKVKTSGILSTNSFKSQPQAEPSFIEIPNNEAKGSTAQIELELPSGIRIKIY
jgi:transposase